MPDLTVIFITANLMPKRWIEDHQSRLWHSVGDYPVITVSRKKSDNAGINLLDDEPMSYWNIYMQMLRACLVADTKYVAIAEDDTLYTPEHFKEFRPKDDEVSYNRARWSLFSWDDIYCWRQRVSNCTLIAPRKLLIQALTERKEKYPNGLSNSECGEVGRWRVEQKLRLTPVKMVEWFSSIPVVQLNHPTGSDERQKNKWKKHGQMRAYDIPYWGKATDIARIYNGH